ncbi:hypothetical protein D3C78_1949530 [compost metagenome]
MFILIVPLTGDRLMALGNDALYPQVIGADQILKKLGGQRGGNIVQQAATVHGSSPL